MAKECWRTNGEYVYLAKMDERRKRVLAIVAGILVARHLKDYRRSLRQQAKSADRVAHRICRSAGRADHEKD
jgi:hypothetical protein